MTHYKVCANTYPPYAYISEDGTTVTGLFSDLMKAISKAVNFTYSYVDMTAHLGVEGNSSFIEGVMMTIRGECDIFGSTLGVTYATSQVVDFTSPVLNTKIQIISAPQPRVARTTTWDLLSGNPLVLGALFIGMICFAILMYLSERVLFKNYTHLTTFSFILWSFYGMLFLEPFRYTSKFISSRMFMGVWMISVVILLSLLGGNLKANMASNDDGAINSVRDLLNTPKVRPIAIKGLPFINIMRISADKDIAKMFERLEKSNGIIDWPIYLNSYHKEDVKNGKAALIVPDIITNAYPFFSGHCDKNGKGVFHIASQDVFSMTYSFLLNKAFPKTHLEKMNQMLMYFSASQVVVKFQRDQKLLHSKCFWNPDNDHKSSNDITLLMGILFVGISLSTLVLILEMIRKKACSKKCN